MQNLENPIDIGITEPYAVAGRTSPAEGFVNPFQN